MDREREVVTKNGERDIEGQKENEQQRKRGKRERESMEDVETTMEKGLSKMACTNIHIIYCIYWKYEIGLDKYGFH